MTDLGAGALHTSPDFERRAAYLLVGALGWCRQRLERTLRRGRTLEPRRVGRGVVPVRPTAALSTRARATPERSGPAPGPATVGDLRRRPQGVCNEPLDARPTARPVAGAGAARTVGTHPTQRRPRAVPLPARPVPHADHRVAVVTVIPAVAKTATATATTTTTTAAGPASLESEPDWSVWNTRHLHDGTIPVEAFTTFRDDRVELIRSAPCPATTSGGTTQVTVDVGATPPPRQADRYPDFAPVLAAARTEHARLCTTAA
jgi:hypothetical protein